MRGNKQPYSKFEKKVVLEAFVLGKKYKQTTVECYIDAVDAWKALYPDHIHEYAAKMTVRIILDYIYEGTKNDRE